MKICFVLPQMLRKPIGGYKMVYEYANRLVNAGHEVGILFLNDNALKRFKIPSSIRKIAISIYTKIEPRWFKLDKKIKKISSTEGKIINKLNGYELAIATGVDTVDKCIYYFCNVHKAYFIQGYEKWLVSEEELNRTYSLGMDNIVISSWLKSIVDRHGKKPAILLRNPIDINVYKCIKPVKDRDIYSIGVLYHKSENKGFKYAYEALIRLKKIFPELKVKIFGTSKPDIDMPSWFDYKFNASQMETVDIYNSISIFLCATISEGFGLTGLEAMSCGAALVSTEYSAVKEYAVDGLNSLLSPIRDVDLLVKNVQTLIYDSDKRMKLALAGIKTAREFSWDCAMNVLQEYIKTIP